MSSIWRKLENVAVAVVGIVMVTSFVMPRRNTAKLIENLGAGFKSVVSSAMALTAIEEREPYLAWEYIYEMSSDDQLELLTDLTDEDFEWLSRVSENLEWM